MEKRCTVYINIFGKYDFITKLSKLSTEEIIYKASELHSFFSDDLENPFSYECLHFRSYLQGIIKNNGNNLGVNELSLLLRQKNLETIFPNIDIALRMLLCMAITNCSTEQSFFTLTRIKNYLRAILEENKLNLLI